MDIDTLHSYRSNAAEVPIMRKWLLWALGASLVIHALLLAYFRVTSLPNFKELPTDRLVPRAFTVNRLDIDPKLLREDTEQTPKEQVKKEETVELKRVELPPDTKKIENEPTEFRAAPLPSEAVAPIVNQKPRVDVKTPELAKMEAASSHALDQEMDALRDKLLSDKTAPANNSLLKFSDSGDRANSRGASSSASVKGFSDLDTLLGEKGLTKGTLPILMPTDLLFDYDKADLRPAAAASLQKLGKLIQKNPQARFSIEGHTDSFGGPEYNQVLSEHRAESVKSWLVANMRIDPAKIQTRGYGSTRMIAPATGTVEEQQLNRRVEIVIKTK